MKSACFRLFSATCLALASLACAAAPTAVRVGLVNSSSDVGFLIADKKGYFREEGLDVAFTPFDSAAKMVAPLGAEVLDAFYGDNHRAPRERQIQVELASACVENARRDESGVSRGMVATQKLMSQSKYRTFYIRQDCCY